jgi:glucose/arabinose dehydrogenase
MAGTSRSRRAADAAAVALGALIGTLGLVDCAAGDAAKVGLRSVGRFDAPIDVVAAPGVKGMIYVVERPGRVVAVSGHKRHRFLDVSRRTTTAGERGLLSIAFSPRFRRDHLVYAYYTNRGGNIEVDSFKASPRKARAASRRRVIVIPHPGESNHNGGQLQFGPGGDLYLGTGDGGGAGDVPGNAQNTNVLLGKLLRIDPRRHGRRYRVPRTNPFVGKPGRDEIFALGLRNPFRFSFDRGRIVIGDVGQDRFEEIDYETHHSLRGANFGWNRFEGNHLFDRHTRLRAGHYEPPIHTYSHRHGCAVIGGYVVHDPRLRRLRGRYVYTDLCNGELRSLRPRRKRARGNRALGLRVPDASSFGEAHGHVYVTSLDGPVFRLAPKR